jgi:uncharacterized protein
MLAVDSPAAHPAARRWQPTPFEHAPRLRNGHVMTVVAWASKRDFSTLPPAEARLIRVSDDTEVLAHCYWQTSRSSRPTLVGLHGLESSSSVHYMKGVALQAWLRGWNAVLLNQRNCGGTEHLTPGLYHSALTADPREVIRSLARTEGLTDFFVVGYSLGGNLTLRLAGELGAHPDVPLRGVVAVCPTMDLERCVRAIERPLNFAYQFNFVRNLRARLRRKAEAWPGVYDLAPLARVWTIRAFDDVYTAPLNGFGDATTYYHRASALRVVADIRIPTLILSAADDPFVPPQQFDVAEVRSNPYIRVAMSAHGGHCAFVGTGQGHQRFWAETTAVNFLDAARR